MKHSWLQRMDLWVRHLLPLGLTLVLVLAGAMPTHLPGFAEVSPLLPLIGIYYWSIYRPELLPSSMVFTIGLLNDVLMGTPLGVSPLVYLLVQGTTASQRRFFLGKPFIVAWCCFALVTVASVLLEWALVSMWYDHVLPLPAVIFEMVLTSACYPLFSWLFGRAQSALLRDA